MDAMRPNTSESINVHQFSNGRSVAKLCQEVVGDAPIAIHPLGEASNNCRAFKLRVKNQKIKCYECQNAERASLTEQATGILLAEGVSIPRVLAVVDHVVFAQWVSGKPLSVLPDRTAWQRMAGYQARIHQVCLPSSDANCRRFIHLEWLLERLSHASRNYACPNRVSVIIQELRDLVPEGLKAGIVQPDFIKPNLVVTNAGELVVVDNELLGIGLGFEFDILNTSHAISMGDPAKQRAYLDAYAKVGEMGTLNEHLAFWDLCYLAKLTGKRFQMADAGIALVCLELLEIKVRTYAGGDCRASRQR